MENLRLKELAGLAVDKQAVSGKTWIVPANFLDLSEDEIVNTLLAAPGGVAKALVRLDTITEKKKAKDKVEKLDDETGEKVEKAKGKLKAKFDSAQNEAAQYCRRAGLIFEKKKAEDEEPDMDMGDGEDQSALEGGKKGDDEEEALPKIVTKIAKKAVGKDVEDLEELIMKVYNAGHKDGEKDAEEKKEVKEDTLSEKHHVKKHGKVTKKGSKAECDAHAVENGGDVVKGDPDELEEGKKPKADKDDDKKSPFDKMKKAAKDEDVAGKEIKKSPFEAEELDDTDLEASLEEDYAQIQAAFKNVDTDRIGKPCMTPKGKGVISGIVKQPKGGADGKAGPYVHSVTVKMGDNTVHTMPANQVKLFKGKQPDGKMLPKSVSSTAINNADKGVTAQGGKESGTKPSSKSMWKA